MIRHNVMFNLCRESGDHGPFNSWDRTAYWNDLRGYRSTTKLDDVFDGNFIIANYGSMAAIDNDDTSAHYEARNNVFAYVRVLSPTVHLHFPSVVSAGSPAVHCVRVFNGRRRYSMMGMKCDFGGHDNSHHHNLYLYVQMGAYLSEYHPHALDGHESKFYSNVVAQQHEDYYIMGQTCNYSQPNESWTAVRGYLMWGNDLDGEPLNLTVVGAKAACESNSWCAGFSIPGSDPDPPGVLHGIVLKKDAGVVVASNATSWLFPRKAGITVAFNNTLYTQSGNVQECGLPLASWQAQNPANDPGSTVAEYPADDTLIAVARTILGLGPAPPPCATIRSGTACNAAISRVGQHCHWDAATKACTEPLAPPPGPGPAPPGPAPAPGVQCVVEHLSTNVTALSPYCQANKLVNSGGWCWVMCNNGTYPGSPVVVPIAAVICCGYFIS